MAGELVTPLNPADFFRESAVGYNLTFGSVMVGDLRGLRLNKLDIDPYNAVFQLPSGITYTTGLTFRFLVVDNGEFASDPGLVVRLGLTFKKLVSGDTPAIGTAGGAEQFSTVTLQSTAGQLTLATFAVANANLDSAGAGDVVAMRLRRNGGNAADTAQGSVILIPVDVTNT